ncbi:MAG: hypothetical protein V7642_259, partial [Burkholderiales bacterium]
WQVPKNRRSLKILTGQSIQSLGELSYIYFL